MPHLPNEVQQAAEEAESGGFTPLEPGQYVLRLANLDTSRSGPKGPYWSWEYDVIDCLDDQPMARHGAKVWNTTSLSPAAAFKIKETFEAFGVPLNIDTDELIGALVIGQIGQQTIQQGKRAGQIGNFVERLMPYADAHRPASWGPSDSDEPL